MLEELKARVLETARAAEAMGLCRHKSGNFSARDEATGLVCLTPSGLDRQRMTAADVVVIDRDARVVEAKPGLRPSSEALMHLAAYECRPEIRAVVHTHSRFALVFAVLRQPVPAVVAEMAHLNLKNGQIPVAPFGQQGTPALAASVKAPLRESDAILLASHGALTVDAVSPEGALLKAAYLEEAAGIYYRARLLAGDGAIPRLGADDLTLRYPGAVRPV